MKYIGLVKSGKYNLLEILTYPKPLYLDFGPQNKGGGAPIHFALVLAVISMLGSLGQASGQS